MLESSGSTSSSDGDDWSAAWTEISTQVRFRSDNFDPGRRSGDTSPRPVVVLLGA